MRVCFTGEAVVEGTQVHRSKLEEYTALVGMQPVKRLWSGVKLWNFFKINKLTRRSASNLHAD